MLAQNFLSLFQIRAHCLSHSREKTMQALPYIQQGTAAKNKSPFDEDQRQVWFQFSDKKTRTLFLTDIILNLHKIIRQVRKGWLLVGQLLACAWSMQHWNVLSSLRHFLKTVCILKAYKDLDSYRLHILVDSRVLNSSSFVLHAVRHGLFFRLQTVFIWGNYDPANYIYIARLRVWNHRRTLHPHLWRSRWLRTMRREVSKIL